MKPDNTIIEALQLVKKLDRINIISTVAKILCIIFIFGMAYLSIIKGI